MRREGRTVASWREDLKASSGVLRLALPPAAQIRGAYTITLVLKVGAESVTHSVAVQIVDAS